MSSFSTDQKLRLITAIREEHKTNQSHIKYRESILNGCEHDFPEKEITVMPEKASTSTFAIRCFLALILFIFYLWCDTCQFNVNGINCQMLREQIETSFTTNIFDFIESFPYTDTMRELRE